MHSDSEASGTRSQVRVATAAIAVALILTPAIAFVAGSRGAPIENRASAEFTGIDEGWNALSSFGDFAADRLPLRRRAVRADGWIDEHVFGEDPAFGGGATPRVITGDEGFLFFAEAFEEACDPPLSAAETAAHLARLATVIEASGRRVLTMVAPDKSSVHPELVPDDLVEHDCAERSSDELWEALDSGGIPGFIDLRDLLRTSSAATGRPLYLRTDSHWDQEGARAAVQAAVDFFQPGLFDPAEEPTVGVRPYLGDLTVLRAETSTDIAPDVSINRPGITPVSEQSLDAPHGPGSGGIDRRTVNEGPADRLVQGRTLVFVDSFGEAARDLFVPYFADVTVVGINFFDEARFARLIAEADQVWILSVERSTAARMAFEIGSTPFVDQLATELPPLEPVTDG